MKEMTRTACGTRRALGAGALLAIVLACPVASHAAGCTLTTVELPVHIVGQRAIATVGINGQNVPMLVDSGAWYSSLSDAAAARLHLHPRYVPDFAMFGINGSTSARIAGADLSLLKGSIPNAQFIVGGNELDSGAMGLLGRNVLSFTDTEYDLAHGVIRFVFPSSECAKANMAYWAGSTPVSEIELRSTDPTAVPPIVATARIDGTPVDVLFDTGATTMVSLAAAKRAGVKAEAMKPARQFHGVGRGSADSWTTPIARFEIGGEAILNNTLWVGDFEIHDADMLLGIDFFLSHRIYVSKQQSRMFFTYAGGPVFAQNVQARAGDAASGSATGHADEALDADGYARRGEASRARGDLRGALADLDRACALEPRNARFFEARAAVHYALKDWDKVGEDDDAALRLDPGLVQARLGRAYLREFKNDREGALADLDVLDKQLAPQDAARRQMAIAYGELHEPARAIAQLDQWIASHRHDIGLASAYNSRCWSRVQLGTDLDKALSDCDDAVDKDPKIAIYVDSRAWVYLRMGQWQKALADFDRGLALRPDGTSSLYGRGIVRLHLGNQAAGEADLAAARKLKPAIDAEMKREGLSQEQLAPRP